MKKSRIIRLFNTTAGVDLSVDEMADIDRLQIKLREDKELRNLMTSTNALGKMKFKFDKVVDDLLLDFIGSRLDLYIKLTEPEVNMFFKSKWFENFRRQAAVT
jgi:type I restriction enzyme R subunit